MSGITGMLLEHFEFYGTKASTNQIKLWAEQLRGIDSISLYDAMRKSWSDSSNTRPVMPSKLIEIALGIVSPNEAWAMVEKLNCYESEAIVWTEEMRLSWGAAYPLIKAGDMIAARMTFIESYRSRISVAIANKKFPKYDLSRGSRERNKCALLEAVAENKISPSTAMMYEPELKIPEHILNNLQIESQERIQIEYQIKELEPDVESKEKIKKLINDFFTKQDEKKENDRLTREKEREEASLNFKNKKEEQLREFNNRKD